MICRVAPNNFLQDKFHKKDEFISQPVVKVFRAPYFSLRAAVISSLFLTFLEYLTLAVFLNVRSLTLATKRNILTGFLPIDI